MMQKLRSFLSICFAVFLAMAAIGPQALAEDARFLRGQIAAHDGNHAAAMEAWLPLAREGHVKAQYGVGSLHAEGQGTPLDMTEALVWWRLAAEQGDDRAQFNIAAMYKAGLGAERDDVQAFSWMERAAERGNRSAQARLSKFYAEGSGVERDSKSAFIWFEIARLAGRTIGASNRDGLLALLNKQDRDDAVRRAAAWRPKSD
jgi:TPR repeat protein